MLCVNITKKNPIIYKGNPKNPIQIYLKKQDYFTLLSSLTNY